MTLETYKSVGAAGFGSALFSTMANAGALPNAPLIASWSLINNEPVPTLGSYGAVTLALLLGCLLYVKLRNHHSILSVALVIGFTGTVVSTAVWIPSVISQTTTLTIEQDGALGCNDSQQLSDRILNKLENKCPADVRVSYTIITDRCVDGALRCDDPDEECVSDGGIIAASETKSLLNVQCGGSL